MTKANARKSLQDLQDKMNAVLMEWGNQLEKDNPGIAINGLYSFKIYEDDQQVDGTFGLVSKGDNVEHLIKDHCDALVAKLG